MKGPLSSISKSHEKILPSIAKKKDTDVLFVPSET